MKVPEVELSERASTSDCGTSGLPKGAGAELAGVGGLVLSALGRGALGDERELEERELELEERELEERELEERELEELEREPPQLEPPKRPPLRCASAWLAPSAEKRTSATTSLRMTIEPTTRYPPGVLKRLKERRPRIGCLVLSVLCIPGLACFAGSAAGLIVPPSEVPAGPGEQAFERELAVAAALGFAVLDQQSLETDRDEHRVDIPLASGECASVVASAWGWVAIGTLRLQRADGTVLVEHESPSGMVAHVQFCVAAAQTLIASIGIEHQDGVLGRAAYSQGTLRYAVSTGRVAGGMDPLNRGHPTAAAADAVPIAQVLSHADALGAGRTLLSPPLEISSYRARLIPESVETFAQLRSMGQNGDARPMNPTVDLLPPVVPAEWRPSAAPGQLTPLTTLRGALAGAVEVPAMVFEFGRAVRVLAIVDAVALGHCVEVHLVRMRWHTTTRARRLGSGSWAASTPHDLNVAHERLCGDQAVYITDGTDTSPYQLRLYAAAP